MEANRIDFLVFTALPSELSALKKVFGRPDRQSAREKLSYAAWDTIAMHDEKDANGSLIAVMPPDKDQVPAAGATSQALKHWSPRCFAVLGIAGGLTEATKLGDVIVGRHIIQWDSKREIQSDSDGEEQQHYSLKPISGSEWGANVAKLLQSDENAYEAWQKECRSQKPAGLGENGPDLHIRDIASGSATVNSENLREMLSGLSRHLQAVETEAAGVLEVLQSRSTVPAMVVRGISDLAAKKDETDAIGEGAWRRYAAENAARLLKVIIERYSIPPSENSPRFETQNDTEDLELALREQANAKFAIKRKLGDTPTSTAGDTAVHEAFNERENRIPGPGHLMSRSIEIRIEEFLIPLIKERIKIEVQLRSEHKMPLTKEGITHLRTKLVRLIDEEWEGIVRSAHDDVRRYYMPEVDHYWNYKGPELQQIRNRKLKLKPSQVGGPLIELVNDLLAEAKSDLVMELKQN